MGGGPCCTYVDRVMLDLFCELYNCIILEIFMSGRYNMATRRIIRALRTSTNSTVFLVKFLPRASHRPGKACTVSGTQHHLRIYSSGSAKLRRLEA